MGDSALGLSFSASKPPRQARLQSSRVDRPTLTSSPSEPRWPVSASARTNPPLLVLDSAGVRGFANEHVTEQGHLGGPVSVFNFPSP